MPVQLVPTQHDPPPAQHEPQADVVPSPKPVGHKGIRVDVEERPAWQGNRFIAVLLVLLLLGGAAGSILTMSPAGIATGTLAAVAALVMMASIGWSSPDRPRS